MSGAPVIDAVTTRLITRPLVRPWGADVAELHVIVVEVTAGSLTGQGFSWTPTIGAYAVQALLDHDVAGFAVSRPAEPELVWDDAWRHLHEAGGGGLTTIALAGLDLALWDLRARAAGAGLSQLLGVRRRSVAAYGSGVNLHYSLEELQEQARRWVATGYAGAKIKVGSPDLDRDVERVAAVREILGPQRWLAVDANQRWDVPSAERGMRALERFDLHWIEEPVRADDLAAYRYLRTKINTPLACGENVHTAYRFREFLAADAMDVVQPNIIRVGGLTPFLRIAQLARAASRTLAPHLLPDLSAQVAFALPEAVWVEEVEDAGLERLGFVDRPTPVIRRGGELELADQPRERGTAPALGLGLAFAEDSTDAPRHDEEIPSMTVITNDLDTVVAAAAEAAPALANSSDEQRAGWLEAVADALDAAAGDLVPVAMAETNLPEARLTGEVARTTGQLRLFAQVVRDGAYLEAVIDHARPDLTPPQPELRRLLVPVGPVAVYSASNFPFAFSVAGGDTASALAVGCPVVIKAHSGHLELSRRTAEIVARALTSAGAPEGTFALVEGFEAGVALVQHPAIRAAAFTGSLHGGRALFDLASGRPAPIPFYAELGSINPVVITPAAVEVAGADLARGLVGSFTLGAGQFCTKPGVVLVPAGAGFEDAVASAAESAAAARLLNKRIGDGFQSGLQTLIGHPAVEVIARAADAGSQAPGPIVLATDASAVVADPETLLAECFGPVTLLIRCAGDDQRRAVLDVLEGSLTATIHAAPGEDVRELAAGLSAVAGRVLFGGWPTGVAVTWSQHHGGPWPATTSIHTSVGASAARRFQRPLTYQDAPESVLPLALREGNPLGIPRRVDGRLEA